MSESHSHSPTPQEESEAKLLAYVEGELDEAGRAEIDRHLESNPNHRRLLEELKVGRDLLRWVPRESAPPELMESFQSQLERAVLLEEEDEEAAQEAGSLRINPWHQFRAVAAVLLLAVMLGIVVFYALPKPQHRGVAISKDAAPATAEADSDTAAGTPAAPMAAATPSPAEADHRGDPAGQPAPARPEIAPTGADMAERRMAKAGPGEPDDAKVAGPVTSEPVYRSKIGPADAGLTAANKAEDTPGPMPSAPLPLVSARDAVAELERTNFEHMSNAVRNLANAQAVQVAIERNAYARPKAGTAAKAAPAAGDYSEPLYVVVNTNEPDKARQQIEQYLVTNGIQNFEVLDQTVAALRSPNPVAPYYGQDRAPAQREAAKPLGEAAGAQVMDQEKLKADTIRGRAGGDQMRGAGEGRAPSGQGGTGGGRERQEAPRDRNARPRPDAVAKGAGPVQGQNEGALQKQQDGPVAQLPDVSQQQQVQQQAQQEVRLEQQQQQQQMAFADDVQRIEGVLVARGMNRKQALAMQQSFNKPTQAQWAGVYEQPAELRRDTRGGGERSQAGVGGASNAYDPTAGAAPPAAPAMPSAPAGSAPVATPAPSAPAANAPADVGGAVRRTPGETARGAPGLQQSYPGQSATRPAAPQSAAGDRNRMPTAPTTRPTAPAAVAQRPGPSPGAAARPGTQPVQMKVVGGVDKNAVGRTMEPARGAGVGQSAQAARLPDGGQPERKRAAEQVVAGVPTTRPAGAAGADAPATAEQADDIRLTDEDRPLDVVIVLQRAPLSAGQNAEQPGAVPGAQAEQLRVPANAAPATSPAAATRPAR